MTTLDFKTKPFVDSLYLNTSLREPRPPAPLPDGGLSLNNNLLSGDHMPGFDALARYIFHTVTGQSLERVPTPSTEGFIGETQDFRVHLFYRSNRSWLRSNEAVLNAQRTALIESANTGNKRCLVFAAARFMNLKILAEKHIEFHPLPYALQQTPDATECKHPVPPSPAPPYRFLHRDSSGWRQLDYERDILGHLDWHTFHYRQAAAFARMNTGNGPGKQNIPDPPGTRLDYAFLAWQLLDVVPNPWQGVRILEEALAMLSECGFSEATLFKTRLALVRTIHTDLCQQVDEQADTLFRRKLDLGEIRPADPL